ncbi:MAG: PAS domain-containing protein [bacterium]|nr:PAS domain-containing protein [bacterium]
MRDQSYGRTLVLAVSILLAAVVVVGGATSSYRKIGSFQPLGFEAQRAAGNWRIVTADPETPLLAGDEILLVNGDSFARTADLEQALRQHVESELLILRDGEILDLAYVLPGLEIDFAYLVLALIGCVYLLVGLYTLLRDQRAPAIVFFLWAVTSAIVYLFSPVGPFDLLDKLLYVGEELARVLLAPLTLHLFTIFPQPIGRRQSSNWTVTFFYLPAAFLILLQSDLLMAGGRWFFGANAAAALGVLDRLELIHLVFFGLAAAAVMAWRLWSTTQREARRQTTWLAIGLLGGYLPFTLLYVLPRTLGASWPDALAPVTVLFLAIVPITFCYAILRYRLWDLGVLVRDTASLALTVLLGVGGFALANLMVNRLVPEDLALGRNLLVFVSGLTIAGLMVPTRRGLGQSLERLQYRGRFGRRRALAEIGKELLNERDLDKLCRRLCDEIESGLDISPNNVLLRRGNVLVAWRGEGGLETPLPLKSFPRDIWSAAVHGLPAIGLADEKPSELELFGAGYRYAFPLTVRDHGLALFVCGYKADGIPLNSDDVDLVRNVLNQTALAIENAQLLKRVQSQLDEMGRLQRFNEEVVAASPAGIAVLDKSNRILSANRAFARLAEQGLDIVRGKPLLEVLPIESLPKPGEGLREISYRSATGEERYVQASIGSLPDPERSGNHVLVVQDVSQRVAMETALKEKDRLASLGVLAAGVAHEVNTPITGISSYAQMLLAETPADDPRRQLLEKVEKQTFRAARIVNNLLNFARKRDGERQSSDFVPLITECLDLLKERMADKGITLEWSPPGPIEVHINEGELQQVFTNLVINAIDAMREEGGTLKIDAETSEDWVWIGIEDTGHGIPAEQLDQIFEPFYSTKMAQGGTGLGLSISHDLIKRHGGDIRVINHPGEGCRFVVELPLAESAPRT